MSYQIEILPSAKRELDALPLQVRERIDKAFEALAINPRPPGVKAMQGYKGLLRIRVGKYRVIYRVEDDRLVVIIVQVGHRCDVYRRK
ncbi:type II toxin-antitoxin system RelE family toxin [Argonema galeatum]|uniref:type II toxin-antitoxin system RelE family toxin n=1 Tax=Argonema galeatum TaxID=2942762 RepID=UPI002011EA75|nr:type II toxin-antitoxin system RelE/ParE family toxin [Argonema galeatum A003/A1]